MPQMSSELGELARLAVQMEDLAQRVMGASENVPDEVTVVDGTESLLITMRRDGSVADFQMESDWKDSIEPDDLGDALLAELKGRNTLDWQGIGADAYKEHTDVQRDAAGELSESANMVADVILNDIRSAQELANAIGIAIVTAIGGFLVGCVSLPPPVTPVGLAVIALALVAFATALLNCKAAYDKRQADIREGLAKLQAPPAGGKSKFGKDHWPQRKLYS